jgi:hypothetical protein
MTETHFLFSKKLEKYPVIQKYYNSYISKSENAHPLTCHLVCNTSLLEFDLERIEKMLSKLDKTPFLPGIVKESKNPTQFFDALSEMKVASKFFDGVDFINKIPKNQKPTPDFEINVDGILISLEVKRIKDKLWYNPVRSEYAQVVDDEKTILSRIIESFPHQTIQGRPHVIIFDCGFSTADPVDFEDILYLKKGELELNPRTKRIKEKNETSEKIFHKKAESGEYKYSNLAGIIGIFDKTYISCSEISENGIPKMTKWSWVFFRNPHVSKDLKIVESAVDRLGLEKFQIKNENLQD